MKVQITHRVTQDDDGYWWIINREGRKIRKISDHKIIKDDAGRWRIKKRNGELSEKGFASLQEAFDYSDFFDRLIAVGVILGILFLIAFICS